MLFNSFEPIGAYNCMFNEIFSDFIYRVKKSKSVTKLYFIRKHTFKSIVDNTSKSI